MKKELLKKYANFLEIKDIVFIIFFASRAYTALFTVFLGSRGIYASMAVLAIGYIIAIVLAFRKKECDGIFYFIILVFAITIIILITAITNPFIKEWILSTQYGIITKTFDVRKAIFATLVILLVRDNKRIIKNMEISAFITFIYMLIQIGLFLYNKSWLYYYMVRDETLVLHHYNMSLGYELVFVSLVFLNKAYRENSFKSYIIGALAFLLAFYYGSRGVIIPMIGFLALIFIFNSTRREKLRIIKRLIATMIIYVLLFNVLGLVEELLQIGSQGLISDSDSPIVQLETQSRNLEMLKSNEFSSSNGRNVIYSLAIEAIKDKFPLGYGVYGDRPFIGDRFRWGYSHNFFLEMIVSFGIFGLISIIGLILFTVKLLTKEKYSHYKELLILLLALNAKLLISDTFWHLNFFWALMGVFIIILTKGKKFKPRLFVYLASSLLFLNIILLGVFINTDIKRQNYTTLNIDKPTVILTFDNISEDSFQMYEILKDKGLVGTSFIDLDNLNGKNEDLLIKNTVKEMAEYGWDFQDIIEDKFLDKMPEDDLQNILDKKRLNYLELGLKEPKAIAPSDGKIKMDTTLHLMQYRNSIRLKGRKRSVYYYTQLKESDFYKLNALNVEENKLDLKENLSYIKNQIDITERNNALLILYVEDSDSKQSYSNEERIKNFNEIVSYLIEKDFDFRTMEQIMEEAEISEKDKTLRNYLKNNIPLKLLD